MHRTALERRRPEHHFAMLVAGLGALCCFFGAMEVGVAVVVLAALSVTIEPV